MAKAPDGVMPILPAAKAAKKLDAGVGLRALRHQVLLDHRAVEVDGAAHLRACRASPSSRPRVRMSPPEAQTSGVKVKMLQPPQLPEK